MKPGNAASIGRRVPRGFAVNWGTKKPVAIDEAIGRTVRWQREHSPSFEFLAQVDYAAEDAALAGGHQQT